MLKIKPFKQSLGACGPACLKMIFGHYGINKSENELAKLTETTPQKGCSEKMIIKVAESFGFKGYQKEKSSIKELKQLNKEGAMVIVDWFSPEEAGHYSVVVGLKKDMIYLADPHFGKIMKHKISWFEERWIDVVKDKLILRGIIVIRK